MNIGNVEPKWPELQAIGIDTRQLEMGINSCPHPIPAEQLTNGVVYELSRQNLKWTTLTDILKTWMGDRMTTSDYRIVRGVINKLVKDRLVLMKKKKTPENMEARRNFLARPFLFTPAKETKTKVAMGKEQDGSGNTAHVPATCITEKQRLQEALDQERDKNKRMLEQSKRQQTCDKKKIRRREALVWKKRELLRLSNQKLKEVERARIRAAAVAKTRMKWIRHLHSRPRIGVSVATQTLPLNIVCEQCLRYEQHIETLVNPEVRPPTLLDTRNKGKYSDAVLKCVLTLLNYNVGIANISSVISTVLQLVNVTPQELPSTSTIQNIAKMRLPLVHLNLSETLSGQHHMTLYSDETKKRGQQFETYVVTTPSDERKVLALKEIPDKSATTNIETFKSVVEDLNSVPGFRLAGDKILANIHTTMSDRAATERSFHELLRNYRCEILPKTVANWLSLAEIERDQIRQMHIFFCGLHLLVNAADKVASSLAKFEAVQNGASTECGSKTVEMVRLACKAFSRGGDEKNGCYSVSSVFLKSRGLKPCLTKFRGNRFNILFHNASVLHFLHPHLLDFLETCVSEPNRMLATVKGYMKDPLLVSCCRAVGLLNKLLTKPLWNLIEEKGNILEMNAKYEVIIRNMRQLDPMAIFQRSVELVPGKQVEKDECFHSLIQSNHTDTVTALALEVLLRDVADLFERLLEDQLPGGVNSDKTPEMFPQCESSLKHNKLPETVFAQLDCLEKCKPAANALTVEGAILFKFNKVGQWLDSLTPEEISHHLIQASKLRQTTVREFKLRHEQIQRAKLELLEKKQEEKKRRDQKLLKEKTDLTESIVFHGLWQTDTQIRTMVATYRTKKEKLNSLKHQINFRKTVLKQEVEDPTLFAFSKQRKVFSVEQLQQNLIQLVNLASQNGDGADVSPLVHQCVLHTFTEADGQDKIYRGRVISQVPGFPEWFNTVYESEPQTVYSFKLNEDLENGWLKIIP